jgi:hypothetical protein
MKNAKAWIGVGVSALTLYLLYLTIDPGKVWQHMTAASWSLVVLTLLTVPVTMWLKVYRWRMLFPDPSVASMGGLQSALYIGYLANTVLPLRVGELLRVFLVGQTDGVGRITVLATVLVEKILDVGTLLLILFVVGLAVQMPAWAEGVSILAGLGVIGFIVAIGVLVLAERPSLALATAIEKRVGLARRLHLRSLAESFVLGFQFAKSPVRLARVMAWSLVMWSGSALSLYLGFAALGLWTTVGHTLFVLVATNLSMVVPSAPGYVGVFHSVVVESMRAFGYDPNQALAAAFVFHAVVFGFFIVGGGYYLIRSFGNGRGLGLGGLVAQASMGAREPSISR